MHITTQQEEFSYAYLEAIVTAAGYSIHRKPTAMDNVGIDIGVEAPGTVGRMLSPRFDAQVKCTTNSSLIRADYLSFPLPVKNYRRLIHPWPAVPVLSTPQLLIVMLVPPDVENWLDITEEETKIRKCAYWLSLAGEAATDNKGTISVHIPRKNLLTPEAVQTLMQRIANSQPL